MKVALLTNYLAEYRVPLYERLARRFELEVLCYGGGERYVPPWFADLDAQLARAPFPARRLHGRAEAMELGRRFDAVIAPFAGGSLLFAAYAGARRHGAGFILWASVWSEPRSPAHWLARPLTRHVYRHADALVTYGDHVRAFVAREYGRRRDVFVAPQSVESALFGRTVTGGEVSAFRVRHSLPVGPIVLYVGRLVPEKGVDVLLDAAAGIPAEATLVLVGDGPLAERAQATPRAHVVGALARAELVAAYAVAQMTVLPSVPKPRFQEPWGLVVNEAMHQGCPVIASDGVGAAAGGLVRDRETGLVVPAGDAVALADAITSLLGDDGARRSLGEAGREAVAQYTYEAMVEAFAHALGVARAARGG